MGGVFGMKGAVSETGRWDGCPLLGRGGGGLAGFVCRQPRRAGAHEGGDRIRFPYQHEQRNRHGDTGSRGGGQAPLETGTRHQTAVVTVVTPFHTSGK